MCCAAWSVQRHGCTRCMCVFRLVLHVLSSPSALKHVSGTFWCTQRSERHACCLSIVAHLSGLLAMSTSRSSRTDTLCSLQDISDSVDSYANSDLDLPGAGGAEGGTCSTLPAEHHTSLTTNDDTLALCDFDCGPPMPRRDMVNKGNSRSQCWVCKPCHCSMTAIIRSWSKKSRHKGYVGSHEGQGQASMASPRQAVSHP